MISKSLQDLLGHLLSGFRYQATHHLCPRTKPNSDGREVVFGASVTLFKVSYSIISDANFDWLV
ncbi:hypothetical protein MTR_2g079770 [Medicago truncatula]|uniref:Uncharacterized protein n=1 Tax=Medicago truncatula TaxID=3880 RepID=A0A072VKV1_MEDTR|nr:hypothetical protein MTR_2g079770 [Medicago truncatula]